MSLSAISTPCLGMEELNIYSCLKGATFFCVPHRSELQYSAVHTPRIVWSREVEYMQWTVHADTRKTGPTAHSTLHWRGQASLTGWCLVRHGQTKPTEQKAHVYLSISPAVCVFVCLSVPPPKKNEKKNKKEKNI